LKWKLNNIESILIEGNLRYLWKILEDQEELTIKKNYPKYPVLILTCMDPRIDINSIFQLEPGDVFVLRNAGNICTADITRSILLAIINYKVKYIIILGHMDCGMTKVNQKDLRMKLPTEFLKLLSNNYSDLLFELKTFFKPFGNEVGNLLEQVKSLEKLKEYFPEIEITGMLYDTKTGWIFKYKEFIDLLRRDNFVKDYEELIKTKNQLIIKLKKIKIKDEKAKEVEENIEDIIEINEEKDAIILEDLDYKETQNEDSQCQEGRNQIEVPKLQIPKIYIPKIKIVLPNYSRNREN
jgi:carbonic anhydrase